MHFGINLDWIGVYGPGVVHYGLSHSEYRYLSLASFSGGALRIRETSFLSYS